MKLYQLADDESVYGTNAGWWIIVSDDGEDELSMPFKTQEEAESALADMTKNRKSRGDRDAN